MNDWFPASWQTKPAAQQPCYQCEADVSRVVEEISKLPPLVTSWEVLALKAQLAEAARGQRFLLQGGDCAESFDHCDSGTIANKLKILLQMSLVLTHGGEKQVIRVGRFAGQYAKPRSADFETRDGVDAAQLSRRSHQSPGVHRSRRTPDPELMLRGYERAALTLNFIRALVSRGFVDPHRLEYWDLDWVGDSPMAEEYRRMAQHHRRRRCDSWRISWACTRANCAGSISSPAMRDCICRTNRRRPGRCRTAKAGSTCPRISPGSGCARPSPDGAHVEYFRGIRNPIAVKVGQAVTPATLRRLIDILQPEDEPGRLTLIHRFGSACIARYLPPLIEAAQRQRQDHSVVLRPDARQHGDHCRRHQDAPVREHSQRARPGLRPACRLMAAGWAASISN